MNVDNVSDSVIPTPVPPNDRLMLIFGRQRSLMGKYHDIEKANGFDVFMGPVDLSERHAQAKLKDFAWRVTEELAEATQALIDHPDTPQHFLEELSDAFHFLVELTIISGWNDDLLTQRLFSRMIENEDRLSKMFLATHASPLMLPRFAAYAVVQALGNAMNTLKNKPWKVTHMLTDKEKYFGFLGEAWVAFIRLADCAGLDADSLYRIYFKKSEVNLFRQRSDY